MKTSNLARKLAVGVAVCVLVAGQASAVTVYESSTRTGNQGDNGPWSLGLDFTVSTPGYVTAIGAFDALNNGEGFGTATIPVAMYYLTGPDAGTIVPGTQVSFTGTSGTLVGSYRFLNVGSVYLDTGDYSIVAGNFGLGGEQDYNAWVGTGFVWPNPNYQNPITFNDAGGALIMGNGRWEDGYPPLVLPPTQPLPYNYPNPTFGSATFDFEPVPEPAAFAIAGLGLLVFACVRRCARLRRKAVA